MLQYSMSTSYIHQKLVLTTNRHATSSENDTVPLFPSPMNGFNEEVGCFSPRHEASTIELFFDLWFVGTFTKCA